MSTQRRSPTHAEPDPDMVGAEAAMHRAARRARQRAEEMGKATTSLTSQGNAGDTGADRGPRPGSVVVSQAPPPGTPARGTFYGRASPGMRRPGEGAPGVTGQYTFSQVRGYEDVPGPLKLEDLPKEARTRIWNLFFEYIRRSTTTGSLDTLDGGPWIKGPWSDILEAKHRCLDVAPLDDWNPAFSRIRRSLREYIEKRPFNKVFDLIQFVLCHPRCPPKFIARMQRTFAASRLAYTIDMGPPPTILPAVSPEEGNAVVESLGTLREAGLHSSAAHLHEASACINRREWAGSVRESIHAVESVARQLDPKASLTLGPALKSLEQHGALHPALKDAFIKLYGYTSDEPGIRHALLDQPDARVGQDEAVFMLGACAAFASFLWSKHTGASR